jgi:thiamine pyrophosphate-dependent acetolactate synthase large subunit-like protein
MQFGNRLNPQTKIIHVDISPEEFSKLVINSI